jgi:hypothetical protein
MIKDEFFPVHFLFCGDIALVFLFGVDTNSVAAIGILISNTGRLTSGEPSA